MKRLKVSVLSLLAGSLLISTPAFAKPDISLVMETKKVTVKNGKEVLSDVKTIAPGDTLLYTIKVLNKGDSRAVEVEPIGNIPENTVYLPDNNSKLQPLYSIDNTSFQVTPKIKVQENGKTVEKTAPVSMYKKIKWVLKKVDPKETYSINYRVKVK